MQNFEKVVRSESDGRVWIDLLEPESVLETWHHCHPIQRSRKYPGTSAED